MIGIVIGSVAVGLVLLIMAIRPVLARIGVGFAFAQPRKALGIVIGLMVAGSVIVSAEIVSHSAAENYREVIVSDESYDEGLVFFGSGSRPSAPVEEVRAALASPQFEGLLADWSVGIRAQLPVQSIDVFNSDSHVWGVDPARHTPLRDAKVLNGSVPADAAAWAQNEAVLTRPMAATLGVDVGDVLWFRIEHDEDSLPEPRPLQTSEESFNGSLVLATQDTFTGSYAHHPLDEYAFSLDVPAGTQRMDFRLDASSATDTTFVIHLYRNGDPVREYRVENNSGEFSWRDVATEGEWMLQVHSPLAANVEFSIQATHSFDDPARFATRGEMTGPLTVRALVSGKGADRVTSEVVFVPLTTLQAAYNTTNGVNTAYVRAAPGADMEALQEELQNVVRAVGDGTGRASLPGSRTEEQLAEARLVTRLTFLATSLFTFMAGLLLIVVIMSLLAEERKMTIATMRAMGANRTAITGMYVVEGSLYASGAAFVAILAGVLLVEALSAPLSRQFSDAGSFRMYLSPLPILAAIGITFAITIATIALAAHRVGRLDPAEAMRGEDRQGHGTRSSNLVVAVTMVAAGALAFLVGVALSNSFLVWSGPVVGVVGFALILGQSRAVPGLIVSASLVILVWTAWRMVLFHPQNESLWDFVMLPVGAVVLVLSAACLFAYSQWIHEGMVKLTARTSGGLGPVVETALSHLRARPIRPFLTIGMLATVLMVITTLATVAATGGPSGYDNSGGFAVWGQTSVDLGDPQEYLAQNPPEEGVDPFPLMKRWAATPWYRSTQLTDEGRTYDRIMRSGGYTYGGGGAVAITPRFIEHAQFGAATVSPAYGSLENAMRAVALDRGLVILSDRAHYWNPGEDNEGATVPVRVGDRLYAGMSDEAGEDVVVRVVALVHDLDVIAVMGHRELITAMAQEGGDAEAGTRIWGVPAKRVSDIELAAALESAFRPVEMRTILAADGNPGWFDMRRDFLFMFTVFLSMGLVIGIVALGLVTVRSTIVRRPEIGIIRSMGGTPGQVILIFAVEALYLVLAAVVIGLIGGLWVAVSITSGFETGTLLERATLVLDPALLAWIYGVTLVAGLATAGASSWHASRIPPAQAVRYVE